MPKPWPNELGFDVGSATVVTSNGYLIVTVPVGPRVEEQPPKSGKFVEIDRNNLCRVPLGTDPLAAVELCRRHGRVFEPFEAGEIPILGGPGTTSGNPPDSCEDLGGPPEAGLGEIKETS